MARVARPATRVSDLSPDAQREELDHIYEREGFWRQLKVLFIVKTGHYPLVLDMLERWILLDEPKLVGRERTLALQRRSELWAALEAFKESVDEQKKVSSDAYHQFLHSATACALLWASYATGVPNRFSNEEYVWVQKHKPEDAEEAADCVLQDPPDLSDARARLAARKTDLKAALGEDNREIESNVAPLRIEDRFEAFLRRTKRTVDDSAMPASPSKRVRVGNSAKAGGASAVPLNDGYEQQEAEEIVSTSTPLANPTVPSGVAASEASSGVANGNFAVKKCERCEGDDVDCIMKVHLQANRPAACELCWRRKRRCVGAVWVEQPDDPTQVSLHALESVVRDLKTTLEAKIDDLSRVVRAQAQEIQELKASVRARSPEASPSHS
ncbi:hypothetical protein EXIGLDRAFT_762281 [Exidia glandulosa HHB12029]|uniref:Zn(2)-C6 fungal-type domain-containing protein n=2 Tax=Exidia glandulosa HHB12029 TaxID=1314781 RepID=A0A165MVC1_EXIGL|nr:hypothetical protein EXIGLDRAFT_762281 [Exidia glandulosa HHB12029]